MKILNTIGAEFAEDAKSILNSLGEVDYKTLTQKELDACVEDYNGVVIGLGLTFHESTLEKAKKMKFIATATTGLDHIDIDFAEKNGIEIISLKGETDFLNTITSTAELAFGLMIDISRRITASTESVKQHEWNREAFRGNSLGGKTLGIVGLGRLGSMMVQYGNGFGMNVIACDPYIEDVVFEKTGAKKVDFDTLVKESDYISVHVHLSDETENMFDARCFKNMKNTAYLINTSRGKIINENDVLEALKGSVIRGYATDVLAEELSFEGTTFKTYPLVEYAKENERMLIVPHIGGMTHESRNETDVFIAEKVQNFAKNKRID